MGCVQSIIQQRSNAYRVNESSTLLEEDDALESKRAKSPESKAAAAEKEQESKAAEIKAKEEKQAEKQAEKKAKEEKKAQKEAEQKAKKAEKAEKKKQDKKSKKDKKEVPQAKADAESKAQESMPQAAAKAKPDPKDYMFCGLKNETRVKAPGCASSIQTCHSELLLHGCPVWQLQLCTKHASQSFVTLLQEHQWPAVHHRQLPGEQLITPCAARMHTCNTLCPPASSHVSCQQKCGDAVSPRS